MPTEEVPLSEDTKWSRATLRFWSQTMPPEAMVEALGIVPTHVHRKGDLVSKRSKAVRKEHGVRVDSSLPTSEPLEEHLDALCVVMEKAAPAFAAIADRCECDIFCGFSSGSGQGGFAMSPQLLKRLAALGIEVIVDLHAPTEVRPEE